MSGDERDSSPLRPAAVADAAELARLSAQLGYPSDAVAMRQRLERLTARTDHAVFVASAGEGASLAGWVHVGAGLWLESGECAEILGLVVDAAARRGGVGRRLAAAAERWGRAAGFERIVVRSNAVRPEAHAFYPSLGYALEKTQRVYGKALSP
ncbi:MAG: GNAT family N-acetyltransferase [Pseudomonadota bacterium]|nr:GNAT family N-acetyltransferase [Pseudomonadota bacterium]